MLATLFKPRTIYGTFSGISHQCGSPERMSDSFFRYLTRIKKQRQEWERRPWYVRVWDKIVKTPEAPELPPCEEIEYSVAAGERHVSGTLTKALYV